jgi:hypothetical protein
MRSRPIGLVCALLAFFYSLTHLVAFVQLFFEHDGIALTPAQIRDAHMMGGGDVRPQEIPKIIHQVYHNWKDPGNTTMPADWEQTRSTCIEKNKDWEYMVSVAFGVFMGRGCCM